MLEKVLKFVYLFLAFSCFVIVIYVQPSNYCTQPILFMNTTDSFKLTITTKHGRFIRIYTSDNGGLGNQMYRLASLYGIGKIVNRTPALNADNKYNQNLALEFKTLFPKLFNTVAFKKTSTNDSIKRSAFGSDCCAYADPKIIHDPNATWMILDGTYYQSYKYFHSFKNDIRVMFDFGPEVLTAMDTYALKLFGNDESHKLCAHIRRGDFLQHANLESQTNFVVPAVLRIVEFLNTELHVDALSLVFIGVKSDFWKALNVTQNFGPYFDHIYNASLSSRGEDMAFGATHCDSFLITASGSTFAWWMAYLGNSERPVFYNGQVSKARNHSKDYHDYDMFPPEWHKLELDNKTGDVRFEKSWNYELFKKFH